MCIDDVSEGITIAPNNGVVGHVGSPFLESWESVSSNDSSLASTFIQYL